ncbi:MAG: 2-C-methyl-D-erythritol 2,4-cyclodiphosphate synthase [Clostridia bacterium]|nr:2-C-methyl-D-erythritol 2,4-cyclodiphosphate synthase [Clostridia bacterium]MBQ5742639.1 2-C-methyl-D-erythritol 2,4-cyclodiphosphate synthase [Clostridia bacterium]
MNFRIGEGYDVHRLVEGRKCIIGGVEIPFEKGLLGHSDADVLLHAVTDALLGAAGLGDIGRRYPDTDPKWKGADSLELLKDTANFLKEQGFFPVNVDCTVICQLPKITPHAEQMRQNIANALGIASSFVNVKGKTEEGLGFTGEGKGIAARAVALVEMQNQK